MSKHQVRVGESRASQLLYTFGVGALIDLPRMSVVVMGLEDWKHREHARKISEERLLSAVQRELGEQVEKLLAPPSPDPQESMGMDPISLSKIGVPVAPFPRFMRCPACHMLAPLSSPLIELKKNPYRAESNRYVHINCQRAKRPPTMLPVRFLVACEQGHLDDFPWRLYVHRGQTSCMGALELRELGASGEPSSLELRCKGKSCGARRRMADAFNNTYKEVLPRCRGRRPHLRDFDASGCGLPLRTILLASSNSWFSDTLTVLSVPVSSDPLAQHVESMWATLQHVGDASILGFLRQTDGLGALAAYSNEEIFESIQRRKAGVDEEEDESHDLKVPEWEVLSQPESAAHSEDFRLVEEPLPSGYEHVLEKVVLAERLRAVTALLGFTRISSPKDFVDDPLILQSRRAPLTRGKPDFVPAAEVKGEGIFLVFRESVIRAWCRLPAVVERELAFIHAHENWRKSLGLPPEQGFPGMRYILLHSISHALMRQFSLSCGYSAASLSERIYARESHEESGPMAGILIYTAAPDSEGTLGGLVSLGSSDRLGGFIEQALEELRLCASDPLCAEHQPLQDNATLHGAACHACLFAPETSCERSNRYLDRSLLVETMAGDSRAFFALAKDL
jgi:hypothetical protein